MGRQRGLGAGVCLCAALLVPGGARAIVNGTLDTTHACVVSVHLVAQGLVGSGVLVTEWWVLTAAHFQQATHLVAPGQAHIVATRGCMGDLVATFVIDGHADNLDTDCMARMQRSPFFETLTGPAP